MVEEKEGEWSSEVCYCFFFFKQKTAYEIKECDWSSDVCSSDLTEKILYLLNSADGIYVTYQVLDSIGNHLSNVNVKVTRLLNGETLEVGNGYTDSSGAITFWMNPDFLNTIVFTKSGYITYTLNQFPTQSIYTLTLGTTSSAGINDYIKGMTFSISPQTGKTLEANTNYYFNFTLNSTYWNVSSFGFNLYGDGTIIGGNSSTIINTTTYNLINVSNYSAKIGRAHV